MKILAVDDEPALLGAFKEMLNIFGDKIDTAENSNTAIQMLDNNPYDLIFIDYNLPDKSGLELLKYIRKQNPTAKVVMLTGCQFMKEDIARFAGVDDYLQKPFEAARVIRIINKYRKE